MKSSIQLALGQYKISILEKGLKEPFKYFNVLSNICYSQAEFVKDTVWVLLSTHHCV